MSEEPEITPTTHDTETPTDDVNTPAADDTDPPSRRKTSGDTLSCRDTYQRSELSESAEFSPSFQQSYCSPL